MTADQLRELQDRGRFFYERFPGAAAAEEWKRFRTPGSRNRPIHQSRRHMLPIPRRQPGPCRGHDEETPAQMPGG